MGLGVDGDGCRGAGACVLAAPGVFDQRDDDGVVMLLDGTPRDDRREAATMSPTATVRVREAP